MPRLETFERWKPEQMVAICGIEVERQFLIEVLKELEDTSNGFCMLTVNRPRLVEALMQEGVAERFHSGSQIFRGEQYLAKRAEWFPEIYGESGGMSCD
jgi:hypothetical protein